MTIELWIAIANVIFSGFNLVFILKLIFNDLHDLRAKLDSHIQWHLDEDR